MDIIIGVILLAIIFIVGVGLIDNIILGYLFGAAVIFIGGVLLILRMMNAEVECRIRENDFDDDFDDK